MAGPSRWKSRGGAEGQVVVGVEGAKPEARFGWGWGQGPGERVSGKGNWLTSAYKYATLLLQRALR